MKVGTIQIAYDRKSGNKISETVIENQLLDNDFNDNEVIKILLESFLKDSNCNSQQIS